MRYCWGTPSLSIRMRRCFSVGGFAAAAAGAGAAAGAAAASPEAAAVGAPELAIRADALSNRAAVASLSGRAAQPPSVSAIAWSERPGLMYILRHSGGVCARFTNRMRTSTISDVVAVCIMPKRASSASTSLSVIAKGEPHSAIVTLLTVFEMFETFATLVIFVIFESPTIDNAGAVGAILAITLRSSCTSFFNFSKSAIGTNRNCSLQHPRCLRKLSWRLNDLLHAAHTHGDGGPIGTQGVFRWLCCVSSHFLSKR